MLSKAGKLYLVLALLLGSFILSSPQAAEARVEARLDKGVEAAIREQLGLPDSELITEDELRILTGLSIKKQHEALTLRGLDRATRLTSIVIANASASLDITALADLESLQLLVVHRDALNDIGQALVRSLESRGLQIIDLGEIDAQLASQPIRVYVDGELMAFTADPVLTGGTTLVQFRPLFEQFGLEVSWDGETRTVSGTKGQLKIELGIGNKTALVNGQELALPTAPQLLNKNTMVPLRFIGEATGRNVIWDGAARVIYIDSTVTSYMFDFLFADETVYSGPSVDGKHHGQGTLTYDGTPLYEGSFNHGIIEGSGKMYDVDNPASYYEGSFKNNRFEGQGKMVFDDGEYYIGQFTNGMRDGKGKMYAADGTLLYNGSFKYDTYHGEGTGHMGELEYRGQYEYGNFHGFGKMYYEGKLAFEGQFQAGERVRGKLFGDGELWYEGYFYEGRPDGNGTYYENGGDISYRGTVRSYQESGYGIIYLEDGKRYIGEVLLGNPDGLGAILDQADKIIESGYYENGEFVSTEKPAASEEQTIRELLRSSDFDVIDGAYENDYDLDPTEGIMLIVLESANSLKQFNSLSRGSKAEFMNIFTQINWGTLLGVETCLTYVLFEDKAYAAAEIRYEEETSEMRLELFPKGRTILQ